jgi:hypothetical protein
MTVSASLGLVLDSSEGRQLATASNKAADKKRAFFSNRLIVKWSLYE